DVPETQRALYQALLSSTLLVPAPDAAVRQVGEPVAQLEEIVTPAGPSLKVPLTPLYSQQGEEMWAAFTDVETMERCLEKLTRRPSQRISIPARDLLALVWASGHRKIIINPGSVPNCAIAGAVIQTLAEGRIPGSERGDSLPLWPVAQPARF